VTEAWCLLIHVDAVPHVRYRFECLFSMTLLSGALELRTRRVFPPIPGHFAARALHSSTLQLNLSRVWHYQTEANQRIPAKVLALS